MSSRRIYSQNTLDTQERFFVTLDELSANSRLPGGVSGFCEQNGIDKRHLYSQRKDRSKGYFEVGWLFPLVAYYQVNARWLLTGRGKPYRSTGE